jgi:nucleotide-binding universal stress UspA family protein
VKCAILCFIFRERIRSLIGRAKATTSVPALIGTKIALVIGLAYRELINHTGKGTRRARGNEVMSRRIQTILVPTDFSKNAHVAVEKGCELARQLGAKLYLLHAQDQSTLRTAIREELFDGDATDELLQARVMKMVEARFSELLATLDRTDLKIRSLSLRGDPKFLITQYASEIKADLVVIGMRGVTAASRIVSAVIGSVTEYVMRSSPCPTLVVRLDHERWPKQQPIAGGVGALTT